MLFPSPGDLPNPGIEPRSAALQADSLPYKPLGKAQVRSDRVPEKLWTEVCDIVQEAVIKTIPKKKKCKKAKSLSEEALQIVVKRKEVKGKGEKERYIHLNAAFQRIARRIKKAFFSDRCKEIEENNRKGKTRDRFRKIRDIKGTFQTLCKDGHNKGWKWYGPNRSRNI